MQANEIIALEKKRKDVRKETYKAMLDQFSRKIRTSSELGYDHAILKVPPFMVGFPKYDLGKAVSYMSRQLTRLGYIVQLVGPLDIKVRWKAKLNVEKEKESEEPATYFPSLINLQKTAQKLRVGKKR
jgi:hypothetical protein